MALWNDIWGDEKISDEELFDMLPDQCFPDVYDLELSIGEDALHIIGADSEWHLQEDVMLAAGPGRMSFFYTGELQFQADGQEGARNLSMSEAGQRGLLQPEDLFLVKRGQPWEFIFSVPGQKNMKIFADVTSVSWNPYEEYEE